MSSQGDYWGHQGRGVHGIHIWPIFQKKRCSKSAQLCQIRLKLGVGEQTSKSEVRLMIFALQLPLLLPSPAIVTVVVQLPQLEASSSGCYYCWSSLLLLKRQDMRQTGYLIKRPTQIVKGAFFKGHLVV